MSTFRKLALASTAATFLLVSIGGLVRATKSGLGCGTDWPHCAGRLVPALQTRAEVIEFSHRAAASVVVVLLIALVVVALRDHRRSPRLLWPAVAALGLVLWQAVLGMIVVKLELQAESVTLHLATALSLLALLVYLSLAAKAADEGPPETTDEGAARAASLAVAAVLGLLLVGSLVTGRGAGLAFSDWPLMNGKLVPDLSIETQALHFLHRGLAAAVGVVIVVVGLRIVRRRADLPIAARFVQVALGTFAIEIVVGALNVWTRLNPIVVTLHLTLGALIWASFVAATLVTHPVMQRVAEANAEHRHAALEAGR